MNSKFLSLLLVLAFANSSLLSMEGNNSTSSSKAHTSKSSKKNKSKNRTEPQQNLDDYINKKLHNIVNNEACVINDSDKAPAVTGLDQEDIDALRCIKDKNETRSEDDIIAAANHLLGLKYKKDGEPAIKNEQFRNFLHNLITVNEELKKTQAEATAKRKFRHKVGAGVLAVATTGLLKDEIVAGVKMAGNAVKNTAVSVKNGVVNTFKEAKAGKLTKKTAALGTATLFVLDRYIINKYAAGLSPINKVSAFSSKAYNAVSNDDNYVGKLSILKFVSKIAKFPVNSYEYVNGKAIAAYSSSKTQVTEHPLRTAAGIFTVAALYKLVTKMLEKSNKSAVEELIISLSGSNVDAVTGAENLDNQRIRNTVITAVALNDAGLLESIYDNSELYSQLTSDQKALLVKSIEELKAN